MERTMTLVLFIMFSLIAAALIVAYVASVRTNIQNGLCTPDPLCAGKSNGQTFCHENGLARCTLQEGCLRSTQQLCTCTMLDGVGTCA